MTDNNQNPEPSETINNTPSNEEIVTEKPYFDDASAPTPNMLNNLNQPQNNDNVLSSQDNQDNLQQGNQTTTSEINNNNNDNDNPFDPYNIEQLAQARRKLRVGENPKILKIMSITLIILFIIDIYLQIGVGLFNPVILIDDFAFLTMAIIYLVLIAKKKPTNHPALGVATVFVWFVGFGIRGFGMTLGGGDFIFPLFLLTIARTFALFLCIPHTCNNY